MNCDPPMEFHVILCRWQCDFSCDFSMWQQCECDNNVTTIWEWNGMKLYETIWKCINMYESIEWTTESFSVPVWHDEWPTPPNPLREIWKQWAVGQPLPEGQSCWKTLQQIDFVQWSDPGFYLWYLTLIPLILNKFSTYVKYIALYSKILRDILTL